MLRNSFGIGVWLADKERNLVNGILEVYSTNGLEDAINFFDGNIDLIEDAGIRSVVFNYSQFISQWTNTIITRNKAIREVKERQKTRRLKTMQIEETIIESKEIRKDEMKKLRTLNRDELIDLIKKMKEKGGKK